jgi:hypothetical protein
MLGRADDRVLTRMRVGSPRNSGQQLPIPGAALGSPRPGHQARSVQGDAVASDWRNTSGPDNHHWPWIDIHQEVVSHPVWVLNRPEMALDHAGEADLLYEFPDRRVEGLVTLHAATRQDAVAARPPLVATGGAEVEAALWPTQPGRVDR